MVKDGQYTNGSIFNRCLEEETTLVYSMGLKFLDNIQGFSNIKRQRSEVSIDVNFALLLDLVLRDFVQISEAFV